MATSTISNTIRDGTGAVQVGVSVIARLRPVAGFRISDSAEIIQKVTTTTNGSGFWSLPLERNANITPANSWWEVEEEVPNDRRVWAISVGAVDATLYASLIEPSSASVFSNYITQAAADARYAAIGTGSTLVINPTSAPYNAVGDGVTNDTAAVQAALDALPNTAGAQFWLPQGKNFLCGALTLNGKSNVTITGPGKITWTGTGSAPSGYIGFKLSGTISNTEIAGVQFIGDGNAANCHAGVWTDSGATLTNVRIVKCYAFNTVVGFQIGSSVGSTDVGCLMAYNYADQIVGTVSGKGYGFAKSGGATSTSLRVIGNHAYGCQRHSYYISVGSKVTLTGNISKDNRAVGGVTSNAGRIDAFVVARCQNVVFTANIVDNAQDGGIDIEPDVSAGQNILGINANGNEVINCVPYGVWLGSGSPDAVGMQPSQAINFVGNQVTANGVVSTIGIRVASGTRYHIGSNQVQLYNVTGTCHGIYIDGTAETAGTANYTDHLVLDNNHVEGTIGGGGVIYGIGFASAFCTSAVTAAFLNNKVSVPTATWYNAVSVTNPNLTIVGTDFDGLTMGVALKPYPMSSPIRGQKQGGVPAAPAAASGLFYLRDNGAGKMQWVALFPSGAVQVIATEP